MDSHQATRPSWVCEECACAWPCDGAKRQLVAQFAGTLASLTIYLAERLVDACSELTDIPPGQLYGRFIGWSRTLAHAG